ncbi:extracellular solute-binding protein [Paenibacillus koleovorans]|uniref:extracellular solute-binding protein n=1 Tax=Paenibacillus koleovorans TaxID=121608 RepID=UPI0013E38860|nr:extracellular solute-binding protein [Paenibacillus koleovorans]
MNDLIERKPFRVKLNKMVKAIRTNIVMGTWKAGDYLPSEQTLAKQYELSNLTVRKGLEALVAEGYIQKIPRVGNQVTQTFKNRAVHIKFGYYADLEQSVGLSSLIDEFQRRNPHIRIEASPIRIQQGSSYADTITELLQQEKLDLVTMNTSDYRLMADQSLLPTFSAQPVNNAIPRPIRQPFLHGETPYAAPFIYSPVLLCYNKAHFRQAGLPTPDSGWTWDELLEQAAKLNVQGERYGFYFYPLSDNRWPIFLLQNGFRLDRSSREALAASVERIVEAMRVCKELFNRPDTFPAYLSDSEVTPEWLFAHGKISMIMTTYFHLNRLLQTDVEYDVAPLPYIREPMTLLLAIGLVVNDRSQAKFDAQLFVDFLQSPEAQAIIRRETLSIPAARMAVDMGSEASPMLNRPANYAMYRDIIPTFRIHSDMNVTSEELQRILNASRLFWANLEDESTLTERLMHVLA